MSIPSYRMDKGGFARRERIKARADAIEADFSDELPSFSGPGHRHSQIFLRLPTDAIEHLDKFLDAYGERAILAQLVNLLDSRGPMDGEYTTFDDMIDDDDYSARADALELTVTRALK